MSRSRFLRVALACLVVCGGAPILAQELDRIERVGAPPIRATVLHDGYDRVTFRIPGRPEASLDSNQVAQIIYDKLPDAFQQGRSYESQADRGHPNPAQAYETAASSFELAAAGDLRAPLKALALYRGAVCRLKLGMLVPAHLAQAEARFEAFLKEFPRSRMTLDATLQLAKARRLNGNFPGAITDLKALEAKALKENLPRTWEAKAKLEQMIVHIAAGRPQDAATMQSGAALTLDGITPRTPLVDALNLRLKEIEGTILIATKDFRGALNFFDRLLEQGRSGSCAATLAAASIGRGDAFLARGRETNSSTDLRLAQLAYAQAHVLDIEDAERSAKALFLHGEVIHILGPERTGSEAPALAQELFRQVTMQYGGSYWSAQARSKLK